MTTQPTPTPNDKHRAAANAIIVHLEGRFREWLLPDEYRSAQHGINEILATIFPDSAPTPVAGEGKPFADMSLDEVLKIENKTSLLIGRPAPVATQAGRDKWRVPEDDKRPYELYHPSYIEWLEIRANGQAHMAESQKRMADACELHLASAQATIEELRRENARDLAEVRRFQGDKIRDSHEIADLRATVARLEKERDELNEKMHDLVSNGLQRQDALEADRDRLSAEVERLVIERFDFAKALHQRLREKLRVAEEALRGVLPMAQKAFDSGMIQNHGELEAARAALPPATTEEKKP